MLVVVTILLVTASWLSYLVPIVIEDFDDTFRVGFEPATGDAIPAGDAARLGDLRRVGGAAVHLGDRAVARHP